MRIWETIVLIAAAATAFKLPANLTNGLYKRSIDNNGNEVIEQLDEYSPQDSDTLAADLDTTTTSNLRWAKRDYLDPWRAGDGEFYRDPPWEAENKTGYPFDLPRSKIVKGRIWCTCDVRINHDNLLKAIGLFERALTWDRVGTRINYESPRFSIHGDAVAFSCNDSILRNTYVLNKHAYRKILALTRYHCGDDVPATYRREEMYYENTGYEKYVPEMSICAHVRDGPTRRCGDARVVEETLD